MSPETEEVTLELPGRKLVLHQVAGLSELVQASLHNQEPGPFWAYLWPSARALAPLIGAIPDLAGRRVLDLGCGLGALGLAAAARGATAVLNDVRPEALELAKRNAERNGLTVETACFDWSAAPADLGAFDAIFAADVFYEDGMLGTVLRFLRKHLADDGLAWISDPMRVMPGGVAGAARLHGLETSSVVLRAGQVLTGGVMLHELHKRKRRTE